MTFERATVSQLITVIYHEPVSEAERYLAMQELYKRKRHKYRPMQQVQLVRKKA